MAKGGGLAKKLSLTPEMADFMGAKKASRTEIIKKIWAYIKKHPDCQDGREIRPDETLEPLLGSKPMDMLKLGGKISLHVIKND